MERTPKYYLAVCYSEIKTDSEGSEETGQVINAIRELSTNELRNFRRYVKKIVEYSQNRHLSKGLLLNYHDFQDACEEYLKNYHETQVIDWGVVEQMSMNLGRLFLNTLNLFRCFLDHTGTTLKRTFRKNPSTVGKWEAATHRCYDESFAYRFMYQLRNYGQHVGMPPLNLEISSEGAEPFNDKDSIISHFHVGLQTQPLLKDKKIFKKLADDINSYGKVIDLIPLLDEWFKYVSDLFKTRGEIEIRSARNAANKIVSLRNEISAPDQAAMCILKIPNDHGEDQLSPTMEWFPEREAEAILKQL